MAPPDLALRFTTFTDIEQWSDIVNFVLYPVHTPIKSIPQFLTLNSKIVSKLMYT